MLRYYKNNTLRTTTQAQRNTVSQKLEHDLHAYQFIAQLKNLPFVEKVMLFGSRARKTYQERSDIDLAIVCPTATDDQWLNVLKIINNADTLLHVDCVRFDRATPELQKQILKDGIML